MKKFCAILLACVSAAAFAGKDDVLISFSSTGPDTYKDGTPVIDGETYALVWTPNGAAFAGFAVDGEAIAPSKTVIKAPVAKGGKCPLVLFQVEEAYANANYPKGTWGVYLLDTRVFAVNEAGVVQKDAQGKDVVTGLDATAVKGYGKVADASSRTLGDVTSVEAIAANALSTAEIKIKKIDFDGDNVLLTVQGAKAGKFELMTTESASVELKAEGVERAAETDEVIISRPKKAGGEFFKVNRK